jgi:hypothetical protein
MFQDDQSRAWPLDSLRNAPARFDAARVDRFGDRFVFLSRGAAVRRGCLGA